MSTHLLIVTEQQVHDAMEYLRSSAVEIGKAKARADLAASKVKHVEALMFKASDETSNDRRMMDARTSPEYVEAINEDAEAAGELAKLYALREAAATRIEIWRTQSSNVRSMKL